MTRYAAQVAAYEADMRQAIADDPDKADWAERPHPKKALNADGSTRYRTETVTDENGNPTYDSQGNLARRVLDEPVMQSVTNQWREFYLEDETGEPDVYRMGIPELYETLGAIKGKEVMDAINAMDPYLAQMMTEGTGIDIAHDDFGSIAAGLKGTTSLDDADLVKIVALKTVTLPRHQLRGLPAPREVFIGPALEAINAA